MLSLLLVVLAAEPIQPGYAVKLLGWSSDGASLAWTQALTTSSPKHHYFAKGKKDELPIETVMAMPEAERKKLKETVDAEDDEAGESQVDEEATFGVVHDVRTGAETKYFLGSKARSLQARGVLQKQSAGMPDSAAFEAWKKANAPVAIKGLEGPSGTKAKVLVGGEAKLAWQTEDSVTITLQLLRGADKAAVTWEDEMAAMYVPHRSVEVWWDPTGKRAAFAVYTAEASTMRGVVEATYRLYVLPAPPRVEVLASARLKAEAERVAGLVEKTGYAVSVMGVATKDRTATVIYAGAAHQEAAQKLAAALNATVDKLTWKANGELVVAVGAPTK